MVINFISQSSRKKKIIITWKMHIRVYTFRCPNAYEHNKKAEDCERSLQVQVRRAVRYGADGVREPGWSRNNVQNEILPKYMWNVCRTSQRYVLCTVRMIAMHARAELHSLSASRSNWNIQSANDRPPKEIPIYLCKLCLFKNGSHCTRIQSRQRKEEEIR